MRSSAKWALLASAALVVSSTQAFAQDAPAAAPPPPAAAPAAAAPASDIVPALPRAAAAPADGTVLVHVDSPSVVTLEHRASPGAGWEHACESPCDVRLPVGDQYRVIGAGLNESNPFALDASKGDRVVLAVAPGSKTKATVGTGLLIGGAVVLVGSVIFGLVAACPSCTFQTGSGGATDTTNTDVIGAATGLAVFGLATGIFGAAWMVDNSHSRVGGAVQAAPPARGSLEGPAVAGLRAPMPSMTSAFSVPVLRF